MRFQRIVIFLVCIEGLESMSERRFKLVDSGQPEN